MSQAYVDNVEKFYLASVESADFVSAAEESRKMINSWVESQTNSRLWEGHSFKITVDSPLCVNAGADTAWGARSRGEMRLQRMEAGTAEGGMVHVSVERNKGSPGGIPGPATWKLSWVCGWQYLYGSQLPAQTSGWFAFFL